MWCRPANAVRWIPQARSRNGSSGFTTASVGVRPFTRLEPYYEGGNDGRVYREVKHGADRAGCTGQRLDDRNRLVLFRGGAIQTFYPFLWRAAALHEGGDIDDTFLRAERTQLIEGVRRRLLVMLLSSLYSPAPSPSR